jgi:glutamate-1-semialdehyde 2,1-aminomutase
MTSISKTADELDWIERAAKVLPAGGFGNFAPDIVINRGRGGRVWDESGNEYVDFLLGSGPMLVGHAHPEIDEAVREQLGRGSTFFANNTRGIELAEEITRAMACAEQVRFVSTGSEADMYAIRLARAHTGREKVLKFEGGYHGMSAESLISLAPERLENFPQGVPDSAGIPQAVRDSVIVAPYNDINAATQLMDEFADELAAIIIEPLQRLIPPAPGFLQALRDETAKRGIVLIFDEVVTGFRLAYGGGQELYGVTPDLCTLGKIIGGGFALAAIAGSEDIMAHFDKSKVGAEGFTMQIGTLSGNPIAAAAGLKTMEILRRPGAYDTIRATGRSIMDALASNFSAVGLAAQVVGDPVLFDVVFTDSPVTNYRGVKRGDADRLKRFNANLRARGVLKPPSKFYISLAHTSEDVDHAIQAIATAAREIG